MRTLLASLAAVAMFAALILVGVVYTNIHPNADANDKITICHAAGQDDTLRFVTLTLNEHAVYGQAGHFYENGTPQAGHENDYFGECEVVATPTPTPTPICEECVTPTPTSTPEPTPTPSPTPEPTPTPVTTPTPTPVADLTPAPTAPVPVTFPDTGGEPARK